MIDFDIIDINEAIEGMSYKKQLEFLNKKESEIKTTIEKVEEPVVLY